MTTVVVADCYEVRYEPQPPLLRGRVLRPLSGAEFTEACELLLAQSERHQCRYWLLDGRADEPIRPADVYGWMNEEFLPRVVRTLGKVPCLAFLARPQFWKNLETHSYGPLAPAQSSPTAYIDWFTDEAAALAWLVAQRYRSEE